MNFKIRKTVHREIIIKRFFLLLSLLLLLLLLLSLLFCTKKFVFRSHIYNIKL